VSGLRRWGRAVALTLVASVVCVLLGLWQLERREQKLARIAEVEANYDAAPVPVAQVLPAASSPLPGGAVHTPVAVSGTYAPAGTLLVRNRPLDGNYGYLVLVPLVLDDASGGGVLVVDRGWVRPGPDGSRPGAVPPPPSGPVSVVARLRPPEAGDDRGAPAGQVQRIDLAGSVAAALRPALGEQEVRGLRTGAYGQLAAEQPRPATHPALPRRPAPDEGPHLGYSLQWFVFAAGMWAFLVVHVRRASRDAAPAPLEAPPAARPARPRRVRDEDVEDAAMDAAEHLTR
jgi:cytochrome oxidase assembly protein ShyY1